MRKIRTKYHLRPDGRIEATKVINGKQKHFYGKSDAEVEAKMAAAEEAATAPLLMAQLIDDWWERKEPQLSPNTINSYLCAKKRINNEFGNVPVKDVTPQSILAFLDEFRRLNYSQKVINNTKSVLKSILDDAVISGEIRSNPCIGLPMVKGKAKTPRQAATDKDVQLIEEHKTDSLIMRMLYVMLYTGLRRGEACALQEKHIDRQNLTIAVVQSCAWDNSKPVLKSPKTAAGVRKIHIPKNALDVIPKYKSKETFVFFPDGLPKRREIEGGLEEARKQFGIQATPHQLRHSYASLLHSAGIDVKDAQHLLGHSTIQMTQDIYTHLEESHKEAVSNKLDNYIVKSYRTKTAKACKTE